MGVVLRGRLACGSRLWSSGWEVKRERSGSGWRGGYDELWVGAQPRRFARHNDWTDGGSKFADLPCGGRRAVVPGAAAQAALGAIALVRDVSKVSDTVPLAFPRMCAE